MPGHQAKLRVAPPAPIPVQQQRDKLAVMREAVSDEFDVETLNLQLFCLSPKNKKIPLKTKII